MPCKDSSLPPYTINGILSRIRFFIRIMSTSYYSFNALCSDLKVKYTCGHQVLYIFLKCLALVIFCLISTVRVIPDFLHHLDNLWLLSLISIGLLKNYPNYLPKIPPSYYSISQKLEFHL